MDSATTTTETVTHCLPEGFDPGCSADRLSETAWGWVLHPAAYDVAKITQSDAAHDSALRVVSDVDAQSIIAGDIESL